MMELMIKLHKLDENQAKVFTSKVELRLMGRYTECMEIIDLLEKAGWKLD